MIVFATGTAINNEDIVAFDVTPDRVIRAVNILGETLVPVDISYSTHFRWSTWRCCCGNRWLKLAVSKRHC